MRLAGVRQRVLHLVRDSRGVVHSWRKHVEHTDSPAEPDMMNRYGTVAGSLRYLGYNGMTHQLSAPGLAYRRVRYEDLVAEPVEVLDEVAHFTGLALGLAEEPELAQAYRRAHQDYLARRATLGEVPQIDGIAGGGMPTRVKCLHVLVAHALAAGPGVNPLGDEALAVLEDWGARGRCV